jgi:hypothetical protein
MIPKWAEEQLGKPINPLFKDSDIALIRAMTQQNVVNVTNSHENNVELPEPAQKRATITLKGRKNGKR